MPSTINFNIEALNSLSSRLSERANTITLVTLADLAQDLRLAAMACQKLASIRSRIAEFRNHAEDPRRPVGRLFSRDLPDDLIDRTG